MKTYEKPAMKLVNLRNENTVANTCWGHHSSGTTLYCDIPGQGYCSFQINKGKCELNLMNVIYYEFTGAPGVPATKDQQAALEGVLVASGGNSGNPYAGEGTTVIVPEPGDPTPDLPDWS